MSNNTRGLESTACAASEEYEVVNSAGRSKRTFQFENEQWICFFSVFDCSHMYLTWILTSTVPSQSAYLQLSVPDIDETGPV